MAYAEDTRVPVEKSKAEIETLVKRYGASEFMSAWREGGATIGFTAKQRHVRFDLDLLSPSDPRFTRIDVRGRARARARAPLEAQGRYEQFCRQRWRALKLVIQAKLESVDAGIESFEEAFMPHILVPGTGRTVAEVLAPALESSYQQGRPQGVLALPPPRDAGVPDAEVEGGQP